MNGPLAKLQDAVIEGGDRAVIAARRWLGPHLEDPQAEVARIQSSELPHLFAAERTLLAICSHELQGNDDFIGLACLAVEDQLIPWITTELCGKSQELDPDRAELEHSCLAETSNILTTHFVSGIVGVLSPLADPIVPGPPMLHRGSAGDHPHFSRLRNPPSPEHQEFFKLSARFQVSHAGGRYSHLLHLVGLVPLRNFLRESGTAVDRAEGRK